MSNMKQTPKILVVAGITGSGTSFMMRSLIAIIELSKYTIVTREITEKDWDKSDTDFIIVKSPEFKIELEAKADLIFTSTRKDEALSKYYEEGIYGVAKAYQQCIQWMRSNKLAYCMDYDVAYNAKGLHNYNNLRWMILPMNYKFQPMKFSDVNPVTLIETIMPELKKKSEEAAAKTDEVLKSKAEGVTDGEKN